MPWSSRPLGVSSMFSVQDTSVTPAVSSARLISTSSMRWAGKAVDLVDYEVGGPLLSERRQ